MLILSIITILTQQLVRSVFIGYTFSSSQLLANQARTLALGGVQLAISQLNMDKKSKNEDEEKKGDPKEKKIKKFLSRILPNINRWQSFELKEQFDGIDGQIDICISCENGKININKAFDFKKLEFNEDYKKLFKGLEIRGKLKAGEIEKKLTEFFKERKKPLNDISELTNVTGLEKIDIFYNPPDMPIGKKKSKTNSNIYLQDLFTTWSDKEQLDLLFLSDSILTVLGLRRPKADDKIVLKNQLKNFINSFNKDWLKNWESNWKQFSPIYGKNIKILKLSEKILSKEFGSNVYSVLSCGKIKNVEQKLLVVLQEIDKEKKDEPKEGSAKEKISTAKKEQEEESSSKTFQIVRMYWL